MRLIALLLALTICASAHAVGSDCWGKSGNWNCFDRLQLQTEAASGDALAVNNSSGTKKFSVNHAGDVTIAGTLTGPTLIDVTAPYTFEDDVTLKGDGTDLLFHTANQNTIGAATKGAKAIFTRAITNETASALTITGASGITLAGTVSASGDIRHTGTVHAGATKIADYTIAAGIMFVHASSGAGADTVITLPDATANAGRIIYITVQKAVDGAFNIVVKSAAGKIGISAAPNGASGVAAATGVTSAVDGKMSAWISNGTDWDLAIDNAGDWVTE
jgi:hypothetical protein